MVRSLEEVQRLTEVALVHLEDNYQVVAALVGMGSMVVDL